MVVPGGTSIAARTGRIIALGLNALAVLWVVAVCVSIAADDARTAELVVLGIQAAVALALQVYVIWRIASGWAVMSTARRLGLTLLGVVVAPIVLALGIFGAVVAAALWGGVALMRSGANRPSTAGRSRSGGSAGQEADAARPPSTRTKCSMCSDGRLPCYPCSSTGYVHENGVAVRPCPPCGGRGYMTCGNCYGNGYTN